MNGDHYNSLKITKCAKLQNILFYFITIESSDYVLFHFTFVLFCLVRSARNVTFHLFLLSFTKTKDFKLKCLVLELGLGSITFTTSIAAEIRIQEVLYSSAAEADSQSSVRVNVSCMPAIFIIFATLQKCVAWLNCAGPIPNKCQISASHSVVFCPFLI